MRVSIIIPFFDEEENVAPVIAEVLRYHPDAEIVAVDDGSSDATFARLSEQEGVRTLRLPSHLGQSAAVYLGLTRATGDVRVLIDGDGQSVVSDIKMLLEHIPDYDFVNGCRAPSRQDALSRVVASRLANSLRDAVIRDGMRDTCGTPKVMTRACVDALVPFDGMHRFIPAILQSAGFRGIEVNVSHRPRLNGSTKHTNIGRAARGVWDLIGVRWLLARSLDESTLRSYSEAGEPAPDQARPERDQSSR